MDLWSTDTEWGRPIRDILDGRYLRGLKGCTAIGPILWSLLIKKKFEKFLERQFSYMISLKFSHHSSFIAILRLNSSLNQYSLTVKLVL
jgi:hypothetical protein